MREQSCGIGKARASGNIPGAALPYGRLGFSSDIEFDFNTMLSHCIKYASNFVLLHGFCVGTEAGQCFCTISFTHTGASA